MRLEARADGGGSCDLSDVQLQLPMVEGATRLVNGFGYKGARRPDEVIFKWDAEVTELTSHNQKGLDCRVWLGGADAGLQINLQGVEQAKQAASSHCGNNDRGELVCDDLIDAQYNVALGSAVWFNRNKGGATVKLMGPSVVARLRQLRQLSSSSTAAAADNGGGGGGGGARVAMVTIYTGMIRVSALEPLVLPLRLLLTPVRGAGGPRTADFDTRYFHMQRFTTVAKATSAAPHPWIILHQGNQLNPYINYPFLTVEPLRQYVKEAHAALLRAQEAATQAAALAKGELERHAPRGELEDRPLAATDLERLVGRTPALEWDEDEHGVRCGVRCTWCRVRVSADAVQTHNVNEHLAGARHRASAAYGGRTIDVFFGGRTRGPAPPPRAAPDQSDLCMGYWKPTLTLSGGVAELRPLLEEEPTKDAVWRPDRWFRNELVVSQGTGAEPASTVIEGTLRAAGCKRYCVGGDGRRATDGMCDACRRLPSDHNFKQMLNARLKAAARPDRDESRINFQLLPRVRLIEMLREKGVLITSLRRNIWLLRQSYLKKAARVRTLLERLDEQRLRGDTKALIEDIIAIERAGKFKQRQTLFHFLRDLVHSLR